MKQNLELHFPDADLKLFVRHFRVEEAMNRPFEIFLTVVSPESLDLAALIGQNARFEAAVRPTGAGLDQVLEDPIVAAWIERATELEGRLARSVEAIGANIESIGANIEALGAKTESIGSKIESVGSKIRTGASWFETTVGRALQVEDAKYREIAAIESELAEIRENLRVEMPTADWSGIVADIEEHGAEVGRAIQYRVHLVHPLWALAQNKNYRIFQHLSEFDMARVMLGEWGLDDNVLVDPTQYKKRDFKIQYGESDLDFIHRNLEDLGISYFLEDSDDGEVITFSANPERSEAREESLRYFDEPPRNTRKAWATRLSVIRAVRPAKYTLQDVDYRFPSDRQPRLTSQFVQKADADLPVAHRVSPLERALETYEYNPGAFAVEGQANADSPVSDRKQVTRTDTKYGTWLTTIRLRSMQASRYRVSFETNAFDLHPGAVTQIEHQTRPELADPVLVIKTTFSGKDTGEWKMVCTAHPTKIPYVPEMVTPRPRASGVETAVVVGVPGAKIDSQEFGSVLVQFHWDREGTRDDNSSCWVPVSYGLAGPGRGMFSLPRVGEEVLVDFLSGDLDKPMVTGRVYTGLNKPWTTDVTKMGDFSIKNDSLTHESQHTGIHLTADTKPLMHLFSTHDKQLTVGNDERNAVKNNRSRTVGGNEVVRIEKCSAHTISQDSNKCVEGDQTLCVIGFYYMRVGALWCSAEETSHILCKQQFHMIAEEELYLRGKLGAQLFTPKILGLVGEDEVQIVSKTKITLQVGSSQICIAEAGIVISAPRVDINPQN